MKMNKCKKDKELFWYKDANKEKRYAYRHRYYDAMGKRKEKSQRGFTTETAAYRKLLEVRAALLDGQNKMVENENMTVSTWCDIWYESNKESWKISTRNQRKSAIESQIKPLIGHHKLSKLDRATYKREFLDHLSKSGDYEVSTIRLFHTIFKICVNAAVENEIIPRNRFTKFTFKVVKDSDPVGENFYTSEELRLFLKYCKEQENETAYTICSLLATTGMRKGEACGLTWEDIDFENKVLSINSTRDNLGDRDVKTENSRRTLELNDSLVRTLQKYRIWCGRLCLMLGEPFDDKNFVFISQQTGKQITENFISNVINRVTKRNALKRITPHGFRHTVATVLINNGVPVTTIAKLLGNTPAMVLSVYSHSFEENEKRATRILDEIVNFD